MRIQFNKTKNVISAQIWTLFKQRLHSFSDFLDKFCMKLDWRVHLAIYTILYCTSSVSFNVLGASFYHYLLLLSLKPKEGRRKADNHQPM